MHKGTPMRNKGYYKLVHAVLRENIRQGRIPAGTRLYTAAVADRLALSPPPVRRALDQLKTEGVLVAHHQHGYVVGGQSDDAVQQGRENLHLLDLDLSLLEGGKTTPLAPRWEMILEEVEQRVLHSIPFGTFQISEAGICDYFGVSRTVSREVLARLDVQGLVEKSRSSHWIVGPLSARTLDETHEMRRLLEPQALVDASPRLEMDTLEAMRQDIEALRRHGSTGDVDEIASLERGLHRELLEKCRNRRMLATIRNLQVAQVVDELFRAHIGKQDETSLLDEHDMVLIHLIKRDAQGAAHALRRHLDLQHQRTRARLKVLSIFDAPNDFPYLTRIH
jgi:DNA-binding GntR family transcriptional regulator